MLAFVNVRDDRQPESLPDLLEDGDCCLEADATRAKGSRLCGDVHFASAVDVASRITPVPGGVGPMTIAMLLRNTVRAAERTVS